ncbi:MAG: hypothetical protein Q9167_000001 [Letrouitia subvulpina]
METAKVLYSENIFYLRGHFSLLFNERLNTDVEHQLLPKNLQLLSPRYLGLVEKIGFAVLDQQFIDYNLDLWRIFTSWILANLPNLKFTYICLTSNGLPSQRFLVRWIRYLDIIPGTKLIVLHGSNHVKRITANILAPLLDNRSDTGNSIRLLGGCLCRCWTIPTYEILDFGFWINIGQRQFSEIDDELDVTNDSPVPKLCHLYKGPMVGCLFCRDRQSCKHDINHKPGRLKPLLTAPTATPSELITRWFLSDDKIENSARPKRANMLLGIDIEYNSAK